MPRCGTRRCAAMAASVVTLVLAPVAVHADQTTTSTHVVEPGETLSQIADALGLDSAALVALNGLDDANVVAVGQSLKLPARAAAASASKAATAQARSYTVVEGDTLWSIAQRFATTTSALAQANALDDTDHLAVGADLALPVGAAATAAAPPAAAPAESARAQPQTAVAGRRSLLVSYTVQAGETLSEIARQFGVRADTIVRASGLDDPNKLAIGAVLKVPVPAKEHVVTPADAPAAPSVAAAAAPSPDKSVAPAAAATVAPAATAQGPSATTKPVAPVAVVAPPSGAPPDGLVGTALRLLGSPYAWGGSSPSGFDCSGFVWYVAHQAGKPISRGLLGEYNSGSHPARDELKPGDLVFFQNTYAPGLSHNGIYIGNGRFASAADEGAGVTISSLATPYWTSHWFGAARLP